MAYKNDITSLLNLFYIKKDLYLRSVPNIVNFTHLISQKSFQKFN